MLDGTLPILPVLRQFLSGRTISQLARALDLEFDTQGRRQLAAELSRLALERVIEIDRQRRWRLPTPTGDYEAGGDEPTSRTDYAGLVAIHARFVRKPGDAEDAEEEAEAPDLPDPKSLLHYYAAALRSDPRGDIVQAPDRHGQQFVLVAGRGAWWSGEGGLGRIEIAEGDVPPSLRQAMARRSRDGGPIAVGWPIAVQRRHGVASIVPVGLAGAEWRRLEDRYEVHLASDAMALNPSFAAAAPGLSRTTAFDLLTDDGGAVGTAEMARRVRDALAGKLVGSLDPTRPALSLDAGLEGIHGALGLFLPTETTFTAGAARDLDAIAAWSPDRIASTALGAVLGQGNAADVSEAPVLNPVPLTGDQLAAARAGLSSRLSVVTGPPGTGKSQVIVSVVASAVAAGRSVLVASKNHQALDALEERLTALAPGTPCLVRTLDPATSRDVGFDDVLRSLALADGGSARPGLPDGLLPRLAALDERRRDALRALEEEAMLRTRLAEHIERLGAIGASPPPRRGWAARLAGWLRRRRPTAVTTLAPGADAGALRSAIEADRAALGRMDGTPPDPVELGSRIETGFAPHIAALFAQRCHVPETERVALADEVADRDLHGSRTIGGDLAARVVARRPVWAASVLGAPNRIPLVDGLFDHVIFDEAGQCDIASALPLLARARHAMVVGDPKQLSFIPGLGLSQERNLMRAHGLPLKGMGRFSQSRRTLFDLAQRMSRGEGVILRDQFRSAPDIVDYVSQAFYGGRLKPGRGDDEFQAPHGMKPGLHWTDVTGRAEPAPEGGTSNPPEAEAVAAHLADILRDGGFGGTVGVIAPFNAQVRALMSAIDAALPAEVRHRAALKVATVDRFQGQERDLIVFSPTVCATSPASAQSFVSRDWRRVNVAISRARAVAHVVGDLTFARSGKVPVLRRLAARATDPRRRERDGGVFDSEWERRLDAAMRAAGLDPKPQYPIAGRWLDFALLSDSMRLDVEVDGRRWHLDADGNRKVGDLYRDAQLKALGWKVRRFWVDELDRDMEGCVERIRSDLVGG